METAKEWLLQKLNFLFALILFICFSASSKTDNKHLVVIFEPFEIIAPKNSPPYYAYLDLMEVDKRSNSMGQQPPVPIPITLKAGKDFLNYLSNKRIQLAELKIVQPPNEEFENDKGRFKVQSNSLNWQETLSPSDQERIRRIGADLVENDWVDSAWDDHVKKVLVENGIVHKTQPSNPDKFEAPISKANHRIQGPIEMCCGLALTNMHKFNIRRFSEGIPREIGSVDTATGEFQIDIHEPNGEIVATLIDEKGKVIGEGSYKIEEKQKNVSGIISSPIIKLSPKKRFYGKTRSIYHENSKTGQAPKDAIISGLSEDKGIPLSKEGQFEDSRFSSFSTSSIEAIAPQHWKTSAILTAGVNSNVTLFPDKLIGSLENILRDNPVFRFTDAIETLVWGKAMQDGKATSGIRVILEDDPTGRVFYLNEFYFPDPDLKSTSSSGIFIVVNSREGFQVLNAFRDKDVFGFKNILVKRKSVAIGDIESSTKVNSTATRIFDAFDGAPLVGILNLQSYPEPLRIEGSHSILLPQVQREGLIFVDSLISPNETPNPMDSQYRAAQYFYNESRGFIRIPGIKKSWIESIKIEKKININPNGGIVVGFYDEEDFEAYLGDGAEDNALEYTLLYFDSTGNLTNDKVGHAGGGFIIFNAPPDAQNVVVQGKNSDTLSSRLIPINPEKISVLNF